MSIIYTTHVLSSYGTEQIVLLSVLLVVSSPLFLNVSSFSSLSRGTGVYMGIYHISYLAFKRLPNLPVHIVNLLTQSAPPLGWVVLHFSINILP